MLRLLLLMRADASASMRVAAAGSDGARQQVAAIEALGGAVEGHSVLFGVYILVADVLMPDVSSPPAERLRNSPAGFETPLYDPFRAEIYSVTKTMLEQHIVAMYPVGHQVLMPRYKLVT